MQYLLIDTHQRCLGTINSQRSLSVGDTFQVLNSKVFAVIDVEQPQRGTKSHSLRVIPVLKAAPTTVVSPCA